MNLSWLIIPAQLESVSPEVVQTVLEGVLLETTSVREVHGSTARLAQLWARCAVLRYRFCSFRLCPRVLPGSARS